MSNFNFEATLYKNIHEPIGTILSEWVDDETITFKYNDISEFNITIPNKYANGMDNIIFKKIKTRMQVVINYNGEERRFLVCNRVDNRTSKKNTKQFTCYSFEETIKKKNISIEAGNYQLKSGIDNTFMDKGILDLISEKIGWDIGYVQREVCYSDEETEVWVTKNYNGGKVNKIKYGDTIFELKNININSGKNSYNNNPLFLTIEFENVKGGNIDFYSVYNNFIDLPFYCGIKGIKGVYINEAGNRNGIKYYFELEDGTIEEIDMSFANVADTNLTYSGIKISYTNGERKIQDTIKYPYINEISTDAYNCLKELQDVYNCVFMFDTMKKEINCYSKNTYGREIGLELSLNTNIIDLKNTESTSIPTGIKVIGNENLSIANENIYGGDIIYDYSYYIENTLSEECVQAWNKYNHILEVKNNEWLELKNKSNEIATALVSCNSEISSLTNKWNYTNEILSVYRANNDTYNQSKIAKELKEIEVNLNNAISLRDSLETKEKEIYDNIVDFNKMCDRKNATDENGKLIFNEETLSELNDIDEIVNYSDNYYSTSYALYKYAKEYLKELIEQKVEFTINSTNMEEYDRLNKSTIIQEGNIYYLDYELQRELEIEKVRLVEMKVNICNGRKTSLTFSSKDEKTSELNKLSNASRQNSKATNTIKKFTEVLYDSQLSNNYVSSVMQGGLNLATNIARGFGGKNQISISSSGIIVKDSDDLNKAIFIGNGCICISNDGFETSKTAITNDAIIADLLAGKILLGNELKIEGMEGLFEVSEYDNGDFGIKIFEKEGGITKEKVFIGLGKQSDGLFKAQFKLIGKDGQLCISEDGIMNQDNFIGYDYVDSTYPMEITFYVDDNVNIIDKCLFRVKKGYMRSTVKSLSSGLTANVNISGQTVTTTTGGGGSHAHNVSLNIPPHYHIVFGATDHVVGNINEYTYYRFEDMNGNSVALPINTEENPTGGGQPLFTKSQNGEYVNTITSTSCDNHSHTVSISGSSQTLNLAHGHPIQYGIFRDTSIATSINVIVNGKTVSKGVTSTYYEKDIKDYLVKGKYNTITIQANGNARIDYSVFLKSFNLW